MKLSATLSVTIIPFYMFVVVSFLSAFATAGEITVCVQLEGGGENVEGALVDCRDDDPAPDLDDLMTSGTTDSSGCVTLTYETKDGAGNCAKDHWDNACLKVSQGNPDIQCRISGECFRTAKTPVMENHNQDVIADFGTVTVEQNIDYCGNPEHNGCGDELWPDWSLELFNELTIAGQDFEPYCNDHDVCYWNCDNTPQSCDLALKETLFDVCDTAQGLLERLWCQFMTIFFFKFVLVYGPLPCERIRKGRCDPTECGPYFL